MVITGLGPVAPNGIGKEAFWEAISAGQSGVRKLTRFDASSYPIQVAAEVQGFDPADYLDPKALSRTERSTHLAVAAAKLAARDAQLEDGNYDPARTGVAIGTAMGGLMFAVEQQVTFMVGGLEHMHPFGASMGSPNASSTQVSIELNAKGPSQSFSTACASSFNAIGYAFHTIREGKAELMIAGGTDAPLCPVIFGAFCLSRVMSTKNAEPIRTPSPFDRDRDGIVLGEGAGVLILEELEHALTRKAHIYAELVGYGATCDAYHIVTPDETQGPAVAAIRSALRDADLPPEEVDYVHAHGSGTPLGDENETLAIKKALGRHAYRVGVSATKSMLGHTQGAAGSLEMIACALAVENGLIPPTINYQHPDPKCDLDYVPNQARRARINVAMLNCFGFGGKNAVFAIRKLS